MGTVKGDYLGASGRFLPLRLYDATVAAALREGRWRPAVVALVAAEAGRSVVEIGAGTGSLTARLRARLAASITVNAVDPDERALAIARSKVGEGEVRWLIGRAQELPLPDASQDAAVSALVLHHLAADDKLAALGEAHRVLKPGGTLVIADFGRPQDPVMSLAFEAIRLADGREVTAGHREGVVGDTMRAAGFAEVEVTDRCRTGFGTVEILRARRR